VVIQWKIAYKNSHLLAYKK